MRLSNAFLFRDPEPPTICMDGQEFAANLVYVLLYLLL